MAKEMEDKNPQSEADKAGESAAASASKAAPTILYSNEDLQAILDEFERKRKKALEEEIEKTSKKLPERLPDQTVMNYVSTYRELIKTEAPQIFEKIGAINRSENAEMQTKGNFKSLSFTKGAPASLEIMGKDSKPIYTLNYHSDGDLIIAEVPATIKAGPMHLLLALQNEKGENIESDKAAYLGIRYGIDGKIKSMNYPEPLEFEGNRCKCTIDGQPYFLKVDKATFKALNVEQTKNRSQSTNRAQDNVVFPDQDEPAQQPMPQHLESAPMRPQPDYPEIPAAPNPIPAARQLKPMNLGAQSRGDNNVIKPDLIKATKEALKKTGLINSEGAWEKSPELQQTASSIKFSANSLSPKGDNAKTTYQQFNEQVIAKAAEMAKRRDKVDSTPASIQPASTEYSNSKSFQPSMTISKNEKREEVTLPISRSTKETMNQELFTKVEENIPIPFTTQVDTLSKDKRFMKIEEFARPLQATRSLPLSENINGHDIPQETSLELRNAAKKVASAVKTLVEDAVTTYPSSSFLHEKQQDMLNSIMQPPPPPSHTSEEESMARALYESDDSKPLEGVKLTEAIEANRVLQKKLKDRTDVRNLGKSGSFDLDEEETHTLASSKTDHASLLESIKRGKTLRQIPDNEKKDFSSALSHANKQNSPENAKNDQERKILARRHSLIQDKGKINPSTTPTEPARQYKPMKKKDTIFVALQRLQPSPPPSSDIKKPSATPSFKSGNSFNGPGHSL